MFLNAQILKSTIYVYIHGIILPHKIAKGKNIKLNPNSSTALTAASFVPTESFQYKNKPIGKNNPAPIASIRNIDSEMCQYMLSVIATSKPAIVQNPTAAIFALKNFGWTDKRELEGYGRDGKELFNATIIIDDGIKD